MERQLNNTPKFWINPNFRLHFPNFNVEWYKVESSILEEETRLLSTGIQLYISNRFCVACVTSSDYSSIDVLYDENTNFENRQLQKWLREIIREKIFRRAEIVLPQRFHELEATFQLFARKVIVKNLKRRVLGLCTFDNIINLVPFLVIMPQSFSDSVMIHEMAHIKYKHHRKSFWTFLSQLLGEDAKQQKDMQDIVLSKYLPYIQFLMKI